MNTLEAPVLVKDEGGEEEDKGYCLAWERRKEKKAPFRQCPGLHPRPGSLVLWEKERS